MNPDQLAAYREKRAAYRVKNAAAIEAYRLAYAVSKKTEKAAYMKKWRSENKESVSAYNQAYMTEYLAKNKDKLSEQQKAYYQKNKAEKIAKARAHAIANPESTAKIKAAWREKNIDRIKVEVKAKYHANKEASIAKSLAWQRANKDKRKISCAKYSAANPDQARATKARRKARQNEAGGAISKADIKSLLVSQKWLCVACRTKLDKSYEADHIVPLARGGSSDKSNMQILCMPCNRSKGAKDPIAFMQGRGFLL
jgi:5-methylcytosine-specific restriction endonuclease McrA